MPVGQSSITLTAAALPLLEREKNTFGKLWEPCETHLSPSQMPYNKIRKFQCFLDV